MPDRVSPTQFAASIKEKYPEYKSYDDIELTNAIIKKFPEYKDYVDLGGPLPAAKARPTSALPSFQEQVEYMTPVVPQEVKPSKYQESVNKDKSEIGKTLSTFYNGIIGSFETLTKFATELPAAFPITPYQFSPVDIGGLAESARAFRDTPLEERLKTAKEGRKGIEEAFDIFRSGYTTRQEEQALKGQFDVMDGGIGLRDIQAFVGMSGGLATDMALGAATGGTTFIAQGMQNSYEDYDAAAEKAGYAVDPAARNLYGLAGGIINGVLEKFAVDKIVGDVPVFRDLQRKVIANVLKNTANVTGKRAVDAIEEAAVAEIRALTNNFKRAGYRALVEGGTEGAQAALEDGAKFAANAVQGNEIFNEQEIAKGFISNVANSAVAGGIFGPVFGAGADVAFGKNVNTEILTDISNARTAEDLDAIRQELTKTFDENNFSQEERDIIMNNANRYAQIKQTIPEGTPALSQAVAIPKIEQRIKIDDEINKKKEYINTVDEALRGAEEQELSYLQDRRDSINDEIRGIVSNDVFTYTEENGKYYKSLEDGAKEEISKNRYDLEQIKKGNYATQTSEGKVQEGGAEGNISQSQGTQTVQDQEADKANVGYRYIVGQEGDDVPVTALLNKKVRIKGQPAILYQQGQTVEARIIGTNRIIEIGNVNKLMNELPEAYEIEVDETLVTETPQGFRIEGQSLQNKNDNPLDAISLDQNGNVMNVVLTTPAGKRRKFRGQVAKDLAYQIQLKEILKNEEQFEEFLAREHQAELDAAAQLAAQQKFEQVQEPAQEQAAGANETISPRDVEPTYGRVTDRGADVRIKKPNRLQRKVLADARRVASALETLIPRTTGQTVQISLHDDSSFEEAVVAAGGTRQDATSRGFYMSKDGSIHLNMDNLDTDTVLHEGFHPVLDFIEATNPKKINEFYNKLASIPGAEAIIAKAKELYGEGDAHKKEAITDFVAAVADGRVVVNPSNFQKIKAFVLNLVKSLGIGNGQTILNVKDETGLVELSKYITEQFTTEDGLVSISDIERFVINDNYAESGNQGVVAASGTINPDNIQQSKISNVNPIQFSKSKTFDEVELVKLPVKSMTDVYNKFGGKAIAINSDPTKVGILKMISGKEIFMYGGPNYTALKPNVDANIGFASTRIQKPNQVSKILNTLFSESNGEGVVLVTTQAPESMLGNAYALEYTLDAISELPKSVLRTAQFKNEFFGKDIAEIKNAFGEKEYAEFVKKFRGADMSNPNVMNDMIQTLLLDVGNNFIARNALVSNMLAGIVKKSTRAGMKDQPGYISKDPNKFIAKQLMDRFGLNEEKLLYEIGENGIVKEFMDNGNWGFVTNGFASDGKISPSDIQEKGITHPQFNAKFYGKDPFILDGGYLIDRLFLPKDIITDSGKPYTTKASIMVAGSMYPKGPIEKIESPDVKGVPQFQKQYADEKIVSQKEVAPGKKLFNEPNPEAAIFEEEFKKSKGIDTPEPAPITKLDENKSKAIADVYDKLVDNPSDPEVQSAYQAMADETMEQYNAIKKSGVKVEIWDGQGEPYKNSGEMISDVRDNKHMYIYSTEEGFGDTPITDKQRKQNALLRDSGVKDVNGKSMLINDIFRFVHDYFGHTRLGNSFGAIGEENAWNVHSRMYSPLARRAMTTETRGQNSWVNFNKSLRNADGTMKKKGDEGYVSPAQRPFAEQKMALLPEEFSQIEESYSVSKDLEKGPQFQRQYADVVNGFYSPIVKKVNEFKQPNASATKWKEIIGVKNDEAVFSGLTDWLNSKKPNEQVSKDEVSKFMSDNRIHITDKSMGGDYKVYDPKTDTEIDMFETLSEAEDFVASAREDGDNYEIEEFAGYLKPKFENYQLPGGKNYKEKLVMLPGEIPNLREKFNKKYPNWGTKPFEEVFSKEDADIFQKALNKSDFISSHFNEPNILVHLRMNTRKDADGKKVLFLEEVQSDWGQKGKREGFSGELQKKNDEIIKKSGIEYEEKGGAVYFYKDGKKLNYDDVPENVRNAIGDTVNGWSGITAAPYVTNTNSWVKLGLKFALKEAVKQGADRIAWTTGEQQNNRYDLRKQVDEITYRKLDEGNYRIVTYKNGNAVERQDVPESGLESALGKDVAERMINGVGDVNQLTGITSLTGLNLSVGGKGMKAFYGDAQTPGIVSNVAKAVVKELTGKDGTIVESKMSTGVQPAIEVTPEIKQAVKEGMPQFQKAPTKSLPKQGILGVAKLAAKEQFRYGALGKEGVILKEKKAGELSAELVKAEKYAKEAILLTKKYKNSVSKTDVIDFMTGKPVQGNLPSDLATALTNAREHVDNLTERLIQLGVIDDQETIDYYRDNKGKYLLRSYEAIDYNEKFGISQALYGKGLNVDNVAKKLKNVDKTVVDAALTFLADRAMAQNSSLSQKDAMEQARIEVNSILSSAEEYVMQRGLTGSTNVQTLSKKLSDEELAPELRALMGEYTDPIYNYYASIFKIASLTSSRQYLNSMKDYGMGKFIFPYPTEDATIKIAAEGSKGLEPLNGMYTFPEIYEALKKAENDKPMLITQLAGRVRKFKTVYNPATHIKNVIGNTGFAISNGHWNYIPEAYKYMRASIVGGDDKDVMRMMDTLNRYGVLNNTLGIGELKQYFNKNESVDDFLNEIYRAGGKNKAMLGKVAGTAKDVLIRRIPKFIEKAYQVEDDLFKILGFVNESNRYAKAIYQKPYQNLTEAQKNDIDGIASEIVKDTYPTFTRVPKFVKSLSKVLFMGNFLAFPVESVRVQYNSLALARKEISSGNPRLKAVGASRIAGAIAYNSIFSSMVYYGFSLAGAGLTGMLGVLNGDDEDETENSKAIQRYVAPWNNNSDKYPTTFADGKLTYYDIGSLDSYSYQKRVWNAFWSNINNKEGFNKAISESMSEGLDPWLQRDFVLENFNKLMTNPNNSIYNPKDNYWKQLQDKSIFVAKQMGPGFVGASLKIADSYTKGDYEKATNEAYSQIVRRYDVDLEKQFKLFINVDNTSKNSKIGFKDAFRNTENIYKKAKESGVKGIELDDKYREAVDKYKEQIGIVRDYYNSAVRGGVPAQNLNKILNASGFKGSIKEGVIRGRFNFPDNMYIKK